MLLFKTEKPRNTKLGFSRDQLSIGAALLYANKNGINVFKK